MEYTVQKLAKLAGVSSRTLRYYDEIGILKPARINSSGYRIYGKDEVDRLQQIMFYRELGLDLDTIKKIITAPNFDENTALRQHRIRLLEEKIKIDILIANVDKTLASKEGLLYMSDEERFEGFKEKLIEENEEKYGEEIRLKYGKEQIEKSNAKFKNMTPEEYKELNELAAQVKFYLAQALKHGDPSSEVAQKAADLHKQWITFCWGSYDKEAHAGLAQMYVDDERFRDYYDKEAKGSAEFLRDAIFIYTGMNK